MSTLDIVGRNPDKYQVCALVAGRNADLLAQQIVQFRPQVAVVASDEILPNLITALEARLPRNEWPELLAGPQARVQAATDSQVDFVMSAIVGVSGLEATYEAIRLGKRVGLANKEVLVASGQLVVDAAAVRALS